MRSAKSLPILWLLVTAPCFGQSANVSVKADAGLSFDKRPFGKYFIEICTLAGEERTLRCSPNPKDSKIPRDVDQLDQTITMKLACDPAKQGDCNPKYPLVVGDDFFVTATADSGLRARQQVLLGSATPVGGVNTVQYRANSPGEVVIRATVRESPRFRAAAPVDLILQVLAKAPPPSAICGVLPPTLGSSTAPLDAPTIVSLLGNPTPFILTAQGPNAIAIYSTRLPLRSEEIRILNSIPDSIAALAGRTVAALGITPPAAKPFMVELAIPHAAALGDLATRVNGLNYSQFTTQDVGSDRIRVTAATQPDCDTWTSFLKDIRRMAWNLISQPMNKKLYYLSSSDVAAAFNGLASGPGTPSASGSTASPAAASASSSAAATPATGTSTTTTATATPAAASAAAAPSAASSTPSATPATPATGATSGAPPATTASNASSATITVAQPPGSNIQITSDTTPCVVAGLAMGNANACSAAPAAGTTSGTTSGSASPSAPSAAATASAPKPSLAMASVAVAAGTGEQNPPDLLVYSDTNPGDDALIQERNRVIAQLDLPRPEVIISAWVTQNSTASPEAMGAFSNMVKGLVADYDQEFERLVLRGWESLKTQMGEPDRPYFNEAFRSYIEDQFVADTFQAPKPGGSAQDLSQAFLDASQAQLLDPTPPVRRTVLGICKRGRYCLGYNDLLNPLKPALTDVFLTIIAAQNPVDAANKAIDFVETATPLTSQQDHDRAASLTERDCDGLDGDSSGRCRAIWRILELRRHPSLDPVHPSCSESDFRGILFSLFFKDPPALREPRVHLHCFRQAAKDLLRPVDDHPPHPAGLIRAAVADFLFNYKMSQQYPHEFSWYDLSHSADALNNAFSPIIDAFNRDLWSYQLFVRADLQYRAERLNAANDPRCCVKRLFGLDKPSFFNDGIVTVRTISGQPTTVNTVTQSYLNASTAPELTSLLSSLTASPSSTTAPGANSLASSFLSARPLGRSAALASLLANYQTTFAQIGRSLQITATPRSLATASAAEIAVTLNADESAAPSYFTGGAVDPAINTSRVASHDTTTRVRVDSIKLFEVSSLSAIVQRSRSRFPVLPPFVEIPYVGTLAGIPLGAAKEFHSSTAILSANVMPTATDIAYGLRFKPDLVVDALNPGPCSFYKGAAGPDVTNACLFRTALSHRDFNRLPIAEFNRNMVRCFATDTSTDGCLRLTFDSVPTVN
jgi:hypothetical protein